MKKIIEVGNFAYMKDNTFEKHGVMKGDVLYVAGDTVVKVKESDPYMLRQMFIAVYMIGDHIDTKRQPFMIDGKRLTRVSKENQERLDAVRLQDFQVEEIDDALN